MKDVLYPDNISVNGLNTCMKFIAFPVNRVLSAALTYCRPATVLNLKWTVKATLQLFGAVRCQWRGWRIGSPALHDSLWRPSGGVAIIPPALYKGHCSLLLPPPGMNDPLCAGSTLDATCVRTGTMAPVWECLRRKPLASRATRVPNARTTRKTRRGRARFQTRITTISLGSLANCRYLLVDPMWFSSWCKFLK